MTGELMDRSAEICGDVPLSGRQRRRYLAQGLRAVATSLGGGVKAQPFRFAMSGREARAKIEQGATPLRVYTCALVDHVVSGLRETEGPIADLGCGSGEHRRFFEQRNGGSFYLGLDAAWRPQWPQEGRGGGGLPRYYAQMSLTELGLASDSLAFVLSSSTLEHVADLGRAIRETARVMRSGTYGLHVVPGVWAIFLYLFHGYRRFSRRALAQAFQEAGLEVVQIWSLGGVGSFLLHGVWITWLEQGAAYEWFMPPPPAGRTRRIRLHLGGRMRRGPMLRAYSTLLRLALRLDRWLPYCPAGYGVLVRKR